MPYYFVHVNDCNAAFVKAEKFFKEEGGLTSKWGKHWKRVHAQSFEDARQKAYKVCSASDVKATDWERLNASNPRDETADPLHDTSYTGQIATMKHELTALREQLAEAQREIARLDQRRKDAALAVSLAESRLALRTEEAARVCYDETVKGTGAWESACYACATAIRALPGAKGG